MSNGERPGWFRADIFDEAERHTITVHDTPIEYRTGGSPGDAILFVHGGRAHSAWWAPQIALFGAAAPKWATMDLSGHGASGWRPDYPPQLWVDEVEAVARRLATDGPLSLVGHSLGGMLSILLASRGTVPLRHVVSVDAIPFPAGAGVPKPEPSLSQPRYSTVADAAAHFATRRGRKEWPLWLAQFVGERSLRRVEDGWTWSHDNSRRVIQRPELGDPGALDPSRLHIILGARSPFAPVMSSSPFFTEVAPGATRETLDTGHDVMMEQPVEFHHRLRAALRLQPL